MRQHSQYNDKDIHWKIWGSKVGGSKRTTFSPKHSDHLQCPLCIQLNESHSFFPGSKVARVDTLTTIISLEPSLQISEAIPPLNLSPPRHILGQLYFTFTSYLCTSLSRGRILSGLIKELFYAVLTSYMHTT